MFTFRLKQEKLIFWSIKRFLSSVDKKDATKIKRSHSIKFGKYMESQPHLQKIREYIPEKYTKLKHGNKPESLYLFDEVIAKEVALTTYQYIKNNSPDTIVCESNVGLGLISGDLLDHGIDSLRLYELCPDFREALKEFLVHYHDRVTLFTKDLFQLERLEFIDKHDYGDRVDQLLKNIPFRKWSDSPILTVVGVMTSPKFVLHLIKSVALQSKLSSYGRIQIFALMHSEDYIMLSAGPHKNLHTYQRRSVLFNLLFDFELIKKYPRKSFMPWHHVKITTRTKQNIKEDPDNMYFVRMIFKKELPVEKKQLLQLYYFVFQFFGRGTKPVVPTLEKWFPDCGPAIMIPTKNRSYSINRDIDIFTTFGELNPQDILTLFLELSDLSNFETSPFMEMIESELVKYETTDNKNNEDEVEYNADIIDDVEKHYT